MPATTQSTGGVGGGVTPARPPTPLPAGGTPRFLCRGRPALRTLRLSQDPRRTAGANRPRSSAARRPTCVSLSHVLVRLWGRVTERSRRCRDSQAGAGRRRRLHTRHASAVHLAHPLSPPGRPFCRRGGAGSNLHRAGQRAGREGTWRTGYHGQNLPRPRPSRTPPLRRGGEANSACRPPAFPGAVLLD